MSSHYRLFYHILGSRHVNYFWMHFLSDRSLFDFTSVNPFSFIFSKWLLSVFLIMCNCGSVNFAQISVLTHRCEARALCWRTHFQWLRWSTTSQKTKFRKQNHALKEKKVMFLGFFFFSHRNGCEWKCANWMLWPPVSPVWPSDFFARGRLWP